jgi:hypothetical protein
MFYLKNKFHLYIVIWKYLFNFNFFNYFFFNFKFQINQFKLKKCQQRASKCKKEYNWGPKSYFGNLEAKIEPL